MIFIRERKSIENMNINFQNTLSLYVSITSTLGVYSEYSTQLQIAPANILCAKCLHHLRWPAAAITVPFSIV